MHVEPPRPLSHSDSVATHHQRYKVQTCHHSTCCLPCPFHLCFCTHGCPCARIPSTSLPVSPPGPSSNITGLVRVAPSAWSLASFSSPMAHLLVCDLPEGREWTVFICVSPASCPGTTYNKYLWEERHGQAQGN